MKRFLLATFFQALTTLAALLQSDVAYAQVPQRISYQAAVHDAGGAVMQNSTVSMRFSLRQGSAAGPVVYQETHATSTNAFGLVNLEIGGGVVNSGSMVGVAWDGGQVFLQVEANTGSGFMDMGTTGLVSVPYALRAQTASTVSGMALNDLADVSAASPGNGQVLQWNGVAWVPANVSAGPAYTAGAGIGIAGNVISNTGDTNASDDITTGSTAGGDLSGTFSNLQIVANAVGNAELSNNAVTSAKIADGTIAAGDLSPMGALNGQVLKWNGSAWAPAADGGGTVNGTTNYLPKFTSANALGNSLVFDNGTNVGIGTATPAYKLDVVGGDAFINGARVGVGPGGDVANTVLGNVALMNNTSGSGNTAVGNGALAFNSSGDDNTSLGYTTMIINTTGSRNTAVGTTALSANVNGSDNVAVGYGAATSNSSGAENVAAGHMALLSNMSGSYNVALGSEALRLGTTLDRCVAIGHMALKSNTAQGNTAVGSEALMSNTAGGANVAIGLSSLRSTTTGGNNTALGWTAMELNQVGVENTAMGSQALRSNTVSGNTAVGAYAMTFNTNGSSNTAVGTSALYANVSGGSLTGLGYESLRNNSTGSLNTAVGARSMLSNTIGASNTAAGADALRSNTAGSSNTALGAQSLYSNTSGGLSAAVGHEALQSNTTGSAHVGIGYAALRGNTTGAQNTAIGAEALKNNTTGSYNVAIGTGAGQFSTTASGNVLIGRYAASASTTGFQNTMIGDLTAALNTTGSYNTAVGANTGPNASNRDNTTCIGTDATATATDQVRVGNVFVSSIGGQVGWSTLSDGRFKSEVQANVPGLDFIARLRPVTYRVDREALNEALGVKESRGLRELGPGPSGDRFSAVTTGFVAQEVEQAAREAGFDFSGVDAPKNESDHYGLRYAEFVVPLVKAVQEQQAQIQLLREENARLLRMVEEVMRSR